MIQADKICYVCAHPYEDHYTRCLCMSCAYDCKLPNCNCSDYSSLELWVEMQLEDYGKTVSHWLTEWKSKFNVHDDIELSDWGKKYLDDDSEKKLKWKSKD